MTDHRRHRGWKELLLGRLPLETETNVFILVNLLDFFMTYWMLMSAQPENGRFYEANPFASYFLYRWGVTKGLLGYKLTTVLVVCLIAQIAALTRLETARRLLIFGTLVIAGVVVYSGLLYVRHTGGPLV